MTEKPVRHSDVERRFIHPALLSDKLFHVEVHKKQKEAAREVLSQYEWMRGKEVKGVDERNLSYDPSRDGPVDSNHRNAWDNRSIASTSAFSKLDMGSERSNTPSLYTGTPQHYNPHSTDNLLQNVPLPGQADFARRNYPGRHSEEGQLPLLDPYSQAPIGTAGVPYPPSAFSRPPLYRNGTSSSSLDQLVYPQDTLHRGSHSGGSADLLPRSRQGSVSDSDPRSRSRQGSVGDLMGQYGSRSRQGSVGDALDQYGRPVRPRQGSAGSNLNLYAQPGPPTQPYPPPRY